MGGRFATLPSEGGALVLSDLGMDLLTSVFHVPYPQVQGGPDVLEYLVAKPHRLIRLAYLVIPRMFLL